MQLLLLSLLWLLFPSSGCKKAPPSFPLALARGDPQRTGESPSTPPRTLTTMRWHFLTGGGEPPLLLPLYERVIVATPSGNLYFLGITDGSLRGKVGMGGEPIGLCALAHGVVAVTKKGSLLHFTEKGLSYRIALPDPPSGAPLCFEEELWIGTKRGFLLKVDPRRGELLFSQRILTPNPTPLAYLPSQDLLLFGGEDYLLYKLLRRDPREPLWFAVFRTPLLHAPVVGEGRIFAVDQEGTVRGYDPEGNLLWERLLAGKPLPPAYSQGILVVATNRGEVVACSGKEGTILWREQGPEVLAPPVVAGGALILCRESGVEIRSLHSGTLLSSFPRKIVSCAEPVVQWGSLLIATGEGMVLSLGE